MSLERGSGSPAAESATGSAARVGRGSDQNTLGKYILKRPIGSGGMGTVYLAIDSETDDTVALKILPKEKAANPGLVKRFQKEAESAAQLRHENIVRVYDAGKADGYLYIALEFVEGTDVSQLIKQRGPLPIRRSLEIIKQVAHALDHAFRQGIVHRDVKPSNMLIKRDGTVKLADMGLARSVDETLDSGVTRVGTTVGTVDYMAPEQARDSKSADIRSDIYSLGCAWYHMLTGAAPFSKGSITNKLYAHIARKRPDPRKKNEKVPETIAVAVKRMMARMPKERFQTPAELVEHLERISARQDPTSQKFLSALSDVVDPQTQASAALPQRSTPPMTRPQIKGRQHQSAGNPAELFRVLSILSLGLIAILLFWWVVTLFFPATGPVFQPKTGNPFAVFSVDSRGNQAGDARAVLMQIPYHGDVGPMWKSDPLCLSMKLVNDVVQRSGSRWSSLFGSKHEYPANQSRFFWFNASTG